MCPTSDQETTSYNFKLTYDDARQFPQRCTPVFPPFCVQCCEPATDYSELQWQIKGEVLDSKLVQSGFNLKQEITYGLVKGKLKIPWCTKHKLEGKKRNTISSISLMCGISLFITILILISWNNFELVWWLIILVGILSFVLAWLLNNILSRVFRISRGPFGVDALVVDKVLGIKFFNPIYGKMFADSNQWQPEP